VSDVGRSAGAGPQRIVVVSAHYPPDFVSGGTLVPQRLARALRERGHDVSVYAGHLDPDRPDLSTWSEVDATGLPVRWIAVRGHVDWAAPTNTANPGVTADFAAYLGGVRPDVVHLHSLQALGAGLVPAAKASGAKVVVTMHDFWWCCARQFLVDRSLTPCSLVVAAGVCPCEVDGAWLAGRNAALAEVLESADVVLMPSQSARAVAVANGLAPGRVRVDENGVPAAPGGRTRTTSSAGSPVRFAYTGGSQELKGVHVLLAAARALRDLPGWELDAYGAADHVRATGWSGRGLPVRFPPAYGPVELPEVLAAHDVLVVPSLMRESHSLVTREALTSGLAVVCTDTLGPEEVVRHGVNGLVVAAGDAQDLTAALRRLVEDRALLAAAQCAPPPPVRTLQDQVEGLELLYAEPPARPPPARRIRTVLFVCGIEGAPLRYRARLPAEALALRGVHSDVRHYRDPELPALAAHADAVVLYRVPATGQVLDLLEQVRSRPEPVPLLFDVDDLIFDPGVAREIPALRLLPPAESRLWLQGVARYRTTMQACDLYIGSTRILCEHAEVVTGLPARRFANGVGTVLAERSDAAVRRPRAGGPLRVGYLSGTTTHDRDWALVEPAVLEVLGRYPGVELWLVGPLTPTPAVAVLGDRIRRLPLQDWRALPELLRDLDVNLAPLEPLGRFNEAKSAIKWLEAALTGTPTIASPTQPFCEAVQDGVNGLLAESHQEWVRALDLLLGDAALRHRLGNRGRRDALLGWSPQVQADRYLDLLEDARALVEAGRPVRHTDWQPVALDEPPLPVTLEPYNGPAAAPGRRVGRLPAYARSATRIWREQGAAGAAAAAGRLGRRLSRRTARRVQRAVEARRRAAPRRGAERR
jgi:glycosyltransferase involved in cell wall biosynthesis